MTCDQSRQVWRHRAGIAALLLGIVSLAGCMVAPRPVRDEAAAALDSARTTWAAPMERECSNFGCEL